MLRIIADDLGLHEAVNDGIVFLLKRGKIHGASLMANGRAFDDAVARVKKIANVTLGVHFVLVEEESLSGIGLPKNHRTFFIKYSLGLIRVGDIEKELRAQLDKIISAGIKPSFINSHQHLHLLPGIMSLSIRLAKEFGIPNIRLVREPISIRRRRMLRAAQALFLGFLSSLAESKIKKAGLLANKKFIGFINAGDLDSDDVSSAKATAAEYRGDVIELGCHPGRENEEAGKRYGHWGGYRWEKEFKILNGDTPIKIFYPALTRPDYSLNSVLIKGLRENEVEVIDFHLRSKSPRDLFEAVRFFKENCADSDLIIAGYNSQILVPLFRLFSGRRIVFNAVLSEYERMIISRGLAPKFSFKAFYYWLIDFIAVHSADLIMVESDHQMDFFSHLFGVSKKKIYKRWIGVDEDKFFYDPLVPKHETFTVLFRGALLPEAGAGYVIKAAKLLEDQGIDFIIIGGGIVADEIKKLIQDVKPENLKHVTDFLSDEELRKTMQMCHVSLGQLSDHPRLGRTLPHKVYESLAMKLPYLTAPNKGVLELVKPDETCLICGSADPASLAEKILWIKDNYSFAEKVAENGYRFYQSELRSCILSGKLLEKLMPPVFHKNV